MESSEKEIVASPEASVEQFEAKADQIISSIQGINSEARILLEQLIQSVVENADSAAKSGVSADEVVKRGKELVQLQERVRNKIREIL